MECGQHRYAIRLIRRLFGQAKSKHCEGLADVETIDPLERQREQPKACLVVPGADSDEAGRVFRFEAHRRSDLKAAGVASPDGSLGVISQELCSSQARAGFGLSSVDSTGEVAPAERVVHGVHRGGPAPRASAFQCAASDGAGVPVGSRGRAVVQVSRSTVSLAQSRAAVRCWPVRRDRDRQWSATPRRWRHRARPRAAHRTKQHTQPGA